jgi:hypothetical protein
LPGGTVAGDLCVPRGAVGNLGSSRVEANNVFDVPSKVIHVVSLLASLRRGPPRYSYARWSI